MSNNASARIRLHAEAALRSLAGCIIELRTLGDDDAADALTRLHDDMARKARSYVAKHDTRRIVGGIGIGPARPHLELVGGKAKKR